MTMSWSDEVAESTQDTARPVRYVPPHLRGGGGGGIIGKAPNSVGTGGGGSGIIGKEPNSVGIGGGSSGLDANQATRRSDLPSRGGRGRGRAVSHRLDHGVDDLTRKLGKMELDDGGAVKPDAYEDIPVEVSGEEVPAAARSFAEMAAGLGERLSENVRRCGYVRPTPVQRHAIPIALAGRDLMACAQTGSGKTAAFCFPIISGIVRIRSFTAATRPHSQFPPECCFPIALVLSPTRELASQIHDEATKFAYLTGVKIVAAYGGAAIVPQLRSLEKGVDILVATPGRLIDMVDRGRVSLRCVKYLTLDEADRMLDMGFEPQIRRIVQRMDMPLPGARQTMLFSATFPSQIQRMASEFLSKYIFLTVGRVGSSTDLISQRVDYVEESEKKTYLMHMLHAQKAEGKCGKHALTLVFVETKKGADALEYCLYMNGFPAIAIHGDKVQMERERALRSFKSGATPILVATDVAARGLDIPHVAHVINYDLPKTIDDYVHRIGRTGRAGKSGSAIAFFSEKNSGIAKPLAELMKESNQKVPQWLSEYTERPSSSSDQGQGYNYRGSRFGGHDYRNSSRNENNFYTGASYAPSYDPNVFAYDNSSSAPASDDYSLSANAEPYPYVTGTQYGFGEGYETVVATGWD